MLSPASKDYKDLVVRDRGIVYHVVAMCYGVGVFAFLISLRENPEVVKRL